MYTAQKTKIFTKLVIQISGMVWTNKPKLSESVEEQVDQNFEAKRGRDLKNMIRLKKLQYESLWELQSIHT